MMSRKELKRAHVVRSYMEGKVSRKRAAADMGVSERQVTRLAKGMREEGEQALKHKNLGRKPAHALTEQTRERVVTERMKREYEGCNHAHFRELLESRCGIKMSYTALYKLLTEAGIASPKKRRKPVKHRRRKRKALAGELLQIDASPYDWLRVGVNFSLHGAIDDATGQFTGLYMTENECRQGYYEVIRRTVENFGVPCSLYSDRHTIFRSPLTDKKAEAGEEAALTQFGRAMAELGCEIIYAKSPQAKGRIERAWQTLQSRLPVELALRGIKSIEDANRFLLEHVHALNARFGKEAAGEGERKSMFVPLRDGDNLDDILCLKEERTTDSAGVFSFRGYSFKVLDEGYPLIPARAKVTVLVGLRDALRVQYKGRTFAVELYTAPKRTKRSAPTAKAVSSVKPHLLHGSDQWKRLWHYESFEDSLAFLYGLFFKDAA